MLEMKSLLIVGGTQKNCGKTTIACEIINKFSTFHDIIGIKITMHQNNQEQTAAEDGGYIITEELNAIGQTDTQRMLQAGAKKCFLIKCHENNIFDAFMNSYDLYCSNQLVVCESNSLRNYVKPGIFIMAKPTNAMQIKTSAATLMQFADLTAILNGKPHNFEHLSAIAVNEEGWELNN